MTGVAAPHSRWRIRENADQLAVSHAAVAEAVASLTRCAALADPTRTEPTLGQRLTGDRGGLRTACLAVMTLLTGLLLAWISAHLVRHLVAAPATVAALPGLLLTLALTCTALLASAAIRAGRPPEPEAAVLRWSLLAMPAAAAIIWIALWLVLTTSTAAWIAVVCGTALVCAVEAGMVAVARSPGDTRVADRRSRLPRRVRVLRRRSERLFHRHASRWNAVAHRYGAALVGTADAACVLARLLAGDADPPLDGLAPYDLLILTALNRYRPGPLATGLDAAMRSLNEVRLALPPDDR